MKEIKLTPENLRRKQELVREYRGKLKEGNFKAYEQLVAFKEEIRMEDLPEKGSQAYTKLFQQAIRAGMDIDYKYGADDDFSALAPRR